MSVNEYLVNISHHFLVGRLLGFGVFLSSSSLVLTRFSHNTVDMRTALSSSIKFGRSARRRYQLLFFSGYRNHYSVMCYSIKTLASPR